jgi:hypothetical protein
LCAAYFLTCCSVSPKHVWSQHLEAWEPPVFSVQYGMENLCKGWGFRVSEFCCFLVFFFFWQVWLQLSAKFLIYGAHTVCFLSLVTSWILSNWFFKVKIFVSIFKFLRELWHQESWFYNAIIGKDRRTLVFSFINSFFCSTVIWTQGLSLPWQALYHLNYEQLSF